MTTEIQEILEKEKILQVIQTLFFHVPVVMIFGKKEYPVKPLKLIPEGLIIESIGRQDREERILFVRSNEKIFEISFDLLGITGNKELLYPRKLSIKNFQDTSSSESKSSKKIFISKMVRQDDIIPNLLSENNKMKAILGMYQNDLRNKLTFLSLYISDKADQRLRLLSEYKKCIFVPNKLEPECVPEDFVPYDEYFQLMKASKVSQSYLSEACVPLYYKGIYLIGYLAAWHTKPLDIQGFQFAQKIADSILKDIYYWNLAQEWIERLEVVYVSKLGLEFYAPNSKNYSKYVISSSTVIFDIFKDKDYITSVRGSIANITPTEKNFQVALEFIFENEKEAETLQSIVNNL